MSKFITKEARKARRNEERQAAALRAQARRRRKPMSLEERQDSSREARIKARVNNWIARERREKHKPRRVTKHGRNGENTIGRGQDISRGYTAAPSTSL